MKLTMFEKVVDTETIKKKRIEESFIGYTCILDKTGRYFFILRLSAKKESQNAIV